MFSLKLLHKLKTAFTSGSILPLGAPGAPLPGPSSLESYRPCQGHRGTGREQLMLPAGSVIPGTPGIGLLWMLFPQALFSAVTWVLGKKLLTCCRSWRRRQKQRQAGDTDRGVGGHHCTRGGGEGSQARPRARASPSQPQGRGDQAGQTGGTCGRGRKPQAFHPAFNPAGLSTSWGHSHFSDRKYMHVWA